MPMYVVAERVNAIDSLRDYSKGKVDLPCTMRWATVI